MHISLRSLEKTPLEVCMLVIFCLWYALCRFLSNLKSEYISNVIFVDQLVQEVNKIIEEYYSHDNQTAYIFTSDHGMTDWGLINLTRKIY